MSSIYATLTECSKMFRVYAGELPPGQRLVIGLNPPFGKENALANQVGSAADCPII